MGSNSYRSQIVDEKRSESHQREKVIDNIWSLVSTASQPVCLHFSPEEISEPLPYLTVTCNFNYKEPIHIKSDLTISLNQLKSCHLCISDKLNDFDQNQLDLKIKSFLELFLSYFCNCIALQLKTEGKNEICRLHERCHDIYSGGREVGTTILIDSVEPWIIYEWMGNEVT